MNLTGLGRSARRGSTTPPWWAPLQRTPAWMQAVEPRLERRPRGTGIARIHAGLRRRLARWIYPEGAGALQPETPSPRTADLLRLAEALVRHHGFRELTHQNILDTLRERINPSHFCVEKWKFSNTITRLFKHPSTSPRPKTYHGVIQVFSNDWPADLPWPSDIPRPAPQLPTRETQA